MGKGELAPSGNVVKCFVHCNALSRRIIYALFSQLVVGIFHSLDTAGGLSTPDLAHPWKK